MRPQAELRRLALDGERVIVDRSGTAPGRGAYVCNAACAGEAVRRRALARAFRRPVAIDPEFVESLS